MSALVTQPWRVYQYRYKLCKQLLRLRPKKPWLLGNVGASPTRSEVII